MILLAGIIGMIPGNVPTTTISENTTKPLIVLSQEKEVVKEKDLRAEKIDAYYTERGMPLAGYGKTFVDVADKYGLDWRLLPAISVRESSGGKHLLSNNPFGWGSCKIPFKNYEEAIDVVGLNLSGNNPNTARYYGTKDNYTKLWYYNGTVMPTYPDEVLAIMDAFENTEVNA
ncbi:MAG: hypothetical protein V1848_02275 [Candidatus Magasanikbacteria bacterium]